MTKKSEPKMVDHKLEYDHDHGGEIVPAGKTIQVTESQAERITAAHAKRKEEEKKAEKASS